MVHEKMEITDRLYGRLAGEDVKETINNLGETGKLSPEDEEIFKQFLAFKKWVEDKKGQ